MNFYFVLVLLKSRKEIEEAEKVDMNDIFNDGNIHNNDDVDRDSFVSYGSSENGDSNTDDSESEDSDTDFELEEGRHFKQEMKWGNSFFQG
jgi:hypothetical protein